MMKPNEILKSLRKQHGYTIQEVSKGTGMTYTMCREYETGDRNLGLQAVIKLADFYHVTTDYILGREPVVPSNSFAGMNLNPDEEKEVMETLSALPSDMRAILINTLVQLIETSRKIRKATDELVNVDTDEEKKSD